MKTIKIYISDDSVTPSVIAKLNRQIPESVKNSLKYKITYPELIDCIENLSARAKKLTKTGTTIHIQKQFFLPDINILIALDFPQKSGFMNKLAGIFRRC